MNLETLQDFLARVYTDSELRKAFCNDGQATARHFGFDPKNASTLSAISARQVNFFAHSLIRKRLTAVAALLPLTRRALAIRFNPLFRFHAERFSLTGSRPYENDALGFCAFLKETAKSELRQVEWGLDALRFDEAQLRAVVSRCIFSVRLLRFPVHALLHSDQRPIPAIHRRLALAIWLRWPSDRLRNVVIEKSVFTESLLESFRRINGNREPLRF